MSKDFVVQQKTISLAPGLSAGYEDLARCKCRQVRFVKNGKSKDGRQNYKCKACGRQSTLDPDSQTHPQVIEMVLRLLGEGMPIAAIARAAGMTRGKVYEIKYSGGLL